ncbi:hypothetical protein IP70_15635 [alpha proteobacterium AAP38]|nr:hypothetical protein IP70_15635 [alpha proteobacterium AAP38]
MASITQASYRASYESNIAGAAQQDANALDAMADAAERGAQAGQELAQATRATEEQVRRMGPTLEQISRRYDENDRLTAQLARSNRQYASELAVLRREQQLGLITAERAEELARRAAVNRDNQIARAQRQAEATRNQYVLASQATTAMAAANEQATGKMGRFSQAIGQGGMQLQDMIVQLTAGTNGFIAIGQQLPQFLGIFGPGGAVAGAIVAFAAMGGYMLTSAGAAEKMTNETSALDKVMGPLTRTIDEQASSLQDLISKYNQAGEAQQVLTRLKLSASLVETTEKLNKQKAAFDDLVQSALAAQEFQTTAGSVPLSAANIVKFGRPEFDIRQTPALANDPVVQLGLRIRELRESGDFVGATDLISKFGKAGEEAGRKLIDTASAITDLDRQSTQAKTFLSLLEQGLVKNYRAANDAGRAAGGYQEALMDLAGERAWVEAARQGEGALRDLARQQAINTAETKVYQAAYRRAAADGVVSAQELAEVTRLTAEAGDLAAKRFDLESVRKGAFGLKDITSATRAFKDEIDDVNRFLAEQAGGVSEAEKAYRPFSAQIEKLNDLLGRKGLSDPQKTEIFGKIAQLETAGAVAMEQAANDAERARQQRIAGLSAETAAMEDRNRIALLEREGTYQAQRAIIDLNTTRALAANEVERQGVVAAAIRRGEIEDLTRINELYGRRAGAIKGAGDIANGNIYAGEAQQFSQLVQKAIADGSVDGASILRAGIASAMDQSLQKFYKAFRTEIESMLPGIGQAVSGALAAFGVAQGVGKMLGLSNERARNAGIGAAGGYLIAGPWGALAGAGIGALFGGQAARDKRQQQMAAEQDALASSVSAFIAAGQTVSDYARRVSALDDKFESLRQEAVRLGQPVEALTASYQKQRAVLRQEFGDDVQAVIDRLTGNQARADLRALTKAQDQRVQDALIAEYDLAQVRRANALELSDFFGTLTEQQLSMMGGLVTAVDRVKARIRDLTATINDQLDTQIDLAQQLADSARTQAKALRDVATSLREQIKSNLTGDLSPLSPGDRYSALSSEFDRLYSVAMTGDQVSAEKIAQAGTSLLEASKAMNATGPNYVNDFDRVQKALAQVATVADIRATAFDRMADLADTQVVILKSIRDLLSSDLGQPTAQAIAAAIADGVLTVDEITAVNTTLNSLYQQFVNLPGASAQAVKTAIEAIRPQLVAGTLTDAQKEALTTGQGAIATALTNFRQDQLEQYRQALVTAGAAITSIGNFLLDPQGRIPAAVEAAFGSVNIDLALTKGIEGLFTQALGGQITFPPLAVQAGQTVTQAVGTWTAEALSTRINSQFGHAIANWTSSDDPRTLVERVNAVFAQAVGAPDWNVSLKSLLDQQSPLVTSLTALTAQFPALIAAMQAQAASDAARGAYDSGLQAYVSPVMRAASSASTALAGAKSVEAAKSLTSTWYQVDASTGAITAQGGKGSDSTSDARAKALATALSTIASQIEGLTGGDITDFAVNAGNKYGSGYNFLQYGIDKAQAYGINDFSGIARGFINDVLATALQGGNSAAIDILRAQDWANLSSSFTSAAQQIYALTNPRPMSAGGIITGGITGRDSVHILGMPGERVLSVPHSVMLETIYRQAARASQGQPASDPAQLAELRALRGEMAASRADRAQQAKVNADLTARLVKSNEQLARLARTEKAGGR